MCLRRIFQRLVFSARREIGGTELHTHTHTHTHDDYRMPLGLRPPRHNQVIFMTETPLLLRKMELNHWLFATEGIVRPCSFSEDRWNHLLHVNSIMLPTDLQPLAQFKAIQPVLKPAGFKAIPVNIRTCAHIYCSARHAYIT